MALLALSGVDFVGNGLNRPECALAHASGRLFAADWGGNGGIAMIDPDGRTRFLRAQHVDRPCRPNGIAMAADGGFIFAHLGAEDGGVFLLRPDGTIEPVLTEIDGHSLPPTNFVHADIDGGLWITVSTRQVPRASAYRASIADGFIIRVDRRGARVVAEGLGYTNEAVPSPDGTWLYVNETFARRTRAFRIAEDGSLHEPRIVAEYGFGIYPDGLAFDVEGYAWITSIVSNTVIRVSPDGEQAVMLADSDATHVLMAENAYRAGAMGRSHLDGVKSVKLRNISSLAFGGADLVTAYLGCLLGQQIARFCAPVAGHPPAHWTFDLAPLDTALWVER